MSLTPKNRKEEWLQGLVDHETTLTPKNRAEEWMKEIIDASGGGGGGGGVLVATITDDPNTPGVTQLDKSWNEIHTTLQSAPAFAIYKVETEVSTITDCYPITQASHDSGDDYYVMVGESSYYCPTADGVLKTGGYE